MNDMSTDIFESEENPSVAADRVVDAIHGHDRFLITTHENPDGDALGSLIATGLGLSSLDKDVTLFLPGSLPLPREYDFLPLDSIVREVPTDADGRVLLVLDCASPARLSAARELLATSSLVINVDHHRDNTRFGGINFVMADASSTAEIIHGLLGGLGIALTPAIAEAIYVGMVTDTGRFQYSTTTPSVFRLAASLLEAGADAQRVFERVYESIALAKIRLLAIAFERASLHRDGRVITSYLVHEDFDSLGVDDSYAEGIVEQLRSVEGVELAATIREPVHLTPPLKRVSLRTGRDDLDVSAIARQFGGGGHRASAGFSADGEIDKIIADICAAFDAAPRDTPAT